MDIFSLIFGGLLIITESWVNKFREEDFVKFLNEDVENYNLPKVETYDFVIVGAGLAGSVLASSLSEHHTVLVLELGGDPPPTTEVPGNGPYIKYNEKLSFIHKSSPHKFAALGNGGVINVTTGKAIGGGSTINGLVFSRGSPYDYDNWANLTRDESWNYNSILSIFKNVENYQGEFPIGNHHGTNGPMTISKQDYAPGLSVWIQAAKELGFEKKDPNGPQMIGFSPVEFNSKFGRRDSVYNAFLKPVIGNRSSLTVRRYAEAQEIILDSTNTKAIGVRYSRHSIQDQIVMVNKEVIISAGVLGSPKLLLKSGIGPRAHLIQANIKPRVDIPVGRSLQDHPGFSIQARVNTSALEHLFFPERDYSVDSLSEFEKYGTGPLTYASVGAIGLGFLASSRAAKQGYPGWPDIQFALQSHYSDGKLNNPSTYIISNHIFNGRPNSKGYVRLNTTNPSGPLDFGFGFYTDIDDTDMDVAVEAIRIAIKLFENTKAYGRLGARVVRDILRGCEGFDWGSEAYWRCYIKQKTTGFYHPTGSCPMGFGKNDPSAVVDSKLKVIGVDRLRVIDASIMPEITNSNIQAPTLAIAIKGTKDILNLWGRGQNKGGGLRTD